MLYILEASLATGQLDRSGFGAIICAWTCSTDCGLCSNGFKVRLPFHIHILLDGESRSKNTGAQAAILAPDHVSICSVETVPEVDPDVAVVLFPNRKAVDASSLDPAAVKHVFIIDSKWKKAAKIAETHEKLKAVRNVALTTTKTSYWRFHTEGVPDAGVCTVEALWAFLNVVKEGGGLSEEEYPDHCFDDLLWYFAHQHALIKAAGEEKQAKRAKLTREGPQALEL